MNQNDIPWMLNEFRIMGWIYLIAILTGRHAVNVYMKDDE